jgi:hypothetical protein
MKIKTADLIGPGLAWAVGMAEGYDLSHYGVDPSIRARVPGQGVHAPWRPDFYWNQGGPIIEREKVGIGYDTTKLCWAASFFDWKDTTGGDVVYGPTALAAAMRCYVASKMGDEVEIPQELL